MRLIGHLNSEPQARAFGDYLYSEGIDNAVEAERDGTWAVWVHAEDQLEPATRALAEFRANPDGDRYAQARTVAARRRAAAEQADEAARERTFTRERVFPTGLRALGLLTLGLVLVSVVVGVLSRGILSDRDLNPGVVQALSITPYRTMGQYLVCQPGLPEVREGQLWRLITPIFLHFGPLHLLFNMMWMVDLGSMIERRRGSLFLLWLVLVIAIASNLAQYLVAGSPAFGGMSGVVYGLIGYVWMKGRFDPDSGLYLHPTTVMMAVIWFFLCLAHIIPNAANVVHGVGFGVGIVWGLLSALATSRRGQS